MHRHRKYLFIPVVFLFITCMNVSWNRIDFGGFSMEIPSYLYISEELTLPGKIFLENTDREIYLIIERRGRQEIFSNDMEFHLGNLPAEYNNLDISNGCAGKFKESETGQLPEGGNLYAMETIVQCGDSVFLMQVSTTADSRKGWYRDDFLRMYNSFRKE